MSFHFSTVHWHVALDKSQDEAHHLVTKVGDITHALYDLEQTIQDLRGSKIEDDERIDGDELKDLAQTLGQLAVDGADSIGSAIDDIIEMVRYFRQSVYSLGK